MQTKKPSVVKGHGYFSGNTHYNTHYNTPLLCNKTKEKEKDKTNCQFTFQQHLQVGFPG